MTADVNDRPPAALGALWEKIPRKNGSSASFPSSPDWFRAPITKAELRKKPITKL